MLAATMRSDAVRRLNDALVRLMGEATTRITSRQKQAVLSATRSCGPTAQVLLTWSGRSIDGLTVKMWGADPAVVGYASIGHTQEITDDEITGLLAEASSELAFATSAGRRDVYRSD